MRPVGAYLLVEDLTARVGAEYDPQNPDVEGIVQSVSSGQIQGKNMLESWASVKTLLNKKAGSAMSGEGAMRCWCQERSIRKT